MATRKLPTRFKDLTKFHGYGFSANIDGTSLTGRITVTDSGVFLCQNKKDGSGTESKQGYHYSWRVGSTGTPQNLKRESVTSFKLTRFPLKKKVESKPLKPAMPTKIAGYDVVKTRVGWSFGCGAIKVDVGDVINLLELKREDDQTEAEIEKARNQIIKLTEDISNLYGKMNRFNRLRAMDLSLRDIDYDARTGHRVDIFTIPTETLERLLASR